MEELYVAIKNPKDLRRNLLESSKVILYNLKDYQNLQTIRKKKVMLLDQLKNQIKEMVLLSEKLSVLIPEKDFTSEVQDIFEGHNLKPLPEHVAQKFNELPDLEELKHIAPQQIVEEQPPVPNEPITEEKIEAAEEKAEESLKESVSDLDKLEAALDKIEEKLNLVDK